MSHRRKTTPATTVRRRLAAAVFGWAVFAGAVCAATPAQDQKLANAAAAQAPAAMAAFTPLCPTLTLNVLYTLSGAQLGNAYCYHFAITQRSKSTVLLTGQNANTDFALTLLKDDGANNPVIGDGDEYIMALTEPGNYYCYLEPYATDGSPINFGVAVSTQIDAYELDDVLCNCASTLERCFASWQRRRRAGWRRDA